MGDDPQRTIPPIFLTLGLSSGLSVLLQRFSTLPSVSTRSFGAGRGGRPSASHLFLFRYRLNLLVSALAPVPCCALHFSKWEENFSTWLVPCLAARREARELRDSGPTNPRESRRLVPFPHLLQPAKPPCPPTSKPSSRISRSVTANDSSSLTRSASSITDRSSTSGASLPPMPSTA